MNFLRHIVVSCCLIAASDAAIVLNQIETFSAQNGWQSGSPNPNPPVLAANAGPLGTGDSALRVTSNGGTGAGSRLVVFNTTAWTGDYLSAGILTLAMDLRNSGSTSLSLRVALDGPGGKFVSAPTVINAFSGWVSAVFSIKASSLISASGTDAAATLADVTELRILHSSTVDYRGAQISSGFQVDNIQAIPEPTTTALIYLVGAMFLFRKR